MDYPFTTDGCSGGMTFLWKIIFRTDPPWNELCVAHDKPYWRGGTAWQRLLADCRLRRGVRRKGYPIWATLMYYAVRIGGHPLLPFPWRWGYGWKYPKLYVSTKL